MKRLGPHWASLRKRVGSARPLLLLLDYDGTLAPIADHPSAAVLPPQTRRLLEELARCPGVRIILISGRMLRDLKQLAGVRGLGYAGNHGLEFEQATDRYVHPAGPASRPLLRELAGRLRTALEEVPGAWVENKRFGLSVHWRAVPSSASRRFHAVVARVIAPYVARQRVRLMPGKRVVEIRPPVRWGKGDLVSWLWRRAAVRSSRLPRPLLIYLGDDRTDESAFRVVNRYRGLSVFVGAPPRATAARWWVSHPREVGALLARLLQTRRNNRS